MGVTMKTDNAMTQLHETTFTDFPWFEFIYIRIFHFLHVHRMWARYVYEALNYLGQ